MIQKHNRQKETRYNIANLLDLLGVVGGIRELLVDGDPGLLAVGSLLLQGVQLILDPVYVH